MEKLNPKLPSGYSPVPPGMIANVVTCLEMRERPAETSGPTPGTLDLVRWQNPDLDTYRDLFRRIGEDWMWVSRLVMPDDELAEILGHPKVEVFALQDGDRRIGLLELDFRKEGECELVFFGVVSQAIGKGAGRQMMNAAIAHAWSKPIDRLWLHTCHFDHPSALSFYQRSGFRPYAFLVEVSEDPRLTGRMRRDAAPHVPLLDLGQFSV